jgi:DNA (cytosine-5)-methyltransferase 1
VPACWHSRSLQFGPTVRLKCKMLGKLEDIGYLSGRPPTVTKKGASVKVGGLFSGVGGFEYGFGSRDFQTVFLCEIDEACRRVLTHHFDGVRIFRDVLSFTRLPRLDILTAGFPCQDFSQAGRTAGMSGAQSGLFDEIIRLIETAQRRPTWVVLENVPFLLHLKCGEAMAHIVSRFDSLGYRWAYRIIDTIAFGRPQRRRRWFFVASTDGDPRDVLLSEDSTPHADPVIPNAFGFYWTEGNRGLGLAPEAIPPLKVGSGFGIPASPAIWDRNRRRLVTPDIVDAERLQGFPVNWTAPAAEISSRMRWKLIGNAVSVPVVRWIARRILSPREYRRDADLPMPTRGWPNAAWGERGVRVCANVSDRPIGLEVTPILQFLCREPNLLSIRAASGFLGRLKASSLRRPKGFVEDIEYHIERLKRDTAQ